MYQFLLGVHIIEVMLLFFFKGASSMSQWVRNLSANAGDMRDVGSIPRLGRSPGEENSNPLQYSWLKNPMARGTWQAIVQRVT